MWLKRGGAGVAAWRPVWSRPAATRMSRAVLVIPALFAVTYEGLGNQQMALFAAFGGFAHLILSSFGGSGRDKLIAHLRLAGTRRIRPGLGPAGSGGEG